MLPLRYLAFQFMFACIWSAVSCNRTNKVDVVSTHATITNPVLPEQPIVKKNFALSDKFNANIVKQSMTEVRSIFHDANGNYWYGTDFSGLYFYDGKNLYRFTAGDGLPHNQVQTIQQDAEGKIWLSLGGFDVYCFDGNTFKAYTTAVKELPDLTAAGTWEVSPGDLWFCAGDGAYRYDGKSFTHLSFPDFLQEKKDMNEKAKKSSAYSVYCTYKDKKGNVWFGTQAKGVCRFDGKSFRWFTDVGVEGPAVRAIYEDKNGVMWFGNNGNGLMRYDPVTDKLTNFTDEHGLANKEFMTGDPGKAGTLARVWSIAEDDGNKLWIATIDAGAWCYDGTSLKNYTTRDGLPVDILTVLYRDNEGRLLVGTGADDVYLFKGNRFVLFPKK